jgi:TolA-binding protein
MMRSVTATALSALIVLAVGGSASAQSARPTDTSHAGEDQPRTDKQANKDQLDRDKMTLKAQVQEQISAADANIDALKKMSKDEKGQTKKRHDDMQKQISDMRDRLKRDLDKIDRASNGDWGGVRPVVDRDVSDMNAQLQRVASVTKVPAPPVGAANRQP